MIEKLSGKALIIDTGVHPLSSCAWDLGLKLGRCYLVDCLQN